MSLLGDILGIGTAAASGGLFGLIGTVVGRTFNYFEIKQKNSFEREKWSHELELHKLQMEARKQETEQEIMLADTEGRWRGLDTSLIADSKNASSYLWVAAIKDLIRPLITLLLGVFLFVQTIKFSDNVTRDALIYAAMTAITWWFGDRAPNMQRGKLQ